jgi:hypothetical protein
MKIIYVISFINFLLQARSIMSLTKLKQQFTIALVYRKFFTSLLFLLTPVLQAQDQVLVGSSQGNFTLYNAQQRISLTIDGSTGAIMHYIPVSASASRISGVFSLPLPRPPWLMLPSGQQIFGLNDINHIQRINLETAQTNTFQSLPPRARIMHLVDAYRILLLIDQEVVWWHTQTNVQQTLFTVNKPVRQIFYLPKDDVLVAFYEETNDYYLNPQAGLVASKIDFSLVIHYLKTQESTIYEGAYPIHNPLLNEVIFFKGRQAVRLDLATLRQRETPFTFNQARISIGGHWAFPLIMRGSDNKFYIADTQSVGKNREYELVIFDAEAQRIATLHTSPVPIAYLMVFDRQTPIFRQENLN